MTQARPAPNEAHPDFTDRTIARQIKLGEFQLTMLTAADLDDDMAAIEESAAALDGMFGNTWPRGMTRGVDLSDLERHHREFIDNIAFAWVVRDLAGAYVGCAYLRPEIGQRGAAMAAHWMRSAAAGHGPAFAAVFHEWLRGPDWPTMELKVVSRP